jgi:hypothetical protein
MLHRLLLLVQRARTIMAPVARPSFSGDPAPPQNNQRFARNDQRQSPRIPLRDTPVHVTDGCLFATATMENISPTGLCLRNIPEQLYTNAEELTVFSSVNPGLPILQIAPRWQKTGLDGKTIGAVILNATDTWRLFFVHNAGHLGI